MKKFNKVAKIVLFSLLFNLSSPLIAETTENISEETKKEKDDEIPQVLKDIRRFEIITLGSLPFVILDSTLVYSGIKYFQNDMSSQYKPSFTPDFTYEEQKNVLLTSLGICVGIGITDLIINLVKRNNKKKRQKIDDTPILITPISEDPEAVKLNKPEKIDDNIDDDIIENIEEDNDIEKKSEAVNPNSDEDTVIEITEENN